MKAVIRDDPVSFGDLSVNEDARVQLFTTDQRSLSRKEVNLLITDASHCLNLQIEQIDNTLLLVLKRNFEHASNEMRNALGTGNCTSNNQLIQYSWDVYQAISKMAMPKDLISKVAGAIPLSKIIALVKTTTEVFEADPRSKGLARTACWIALERSTKGIEINPKNLLEEYIRILTQVEKNLRKNTVLKNCTRTIAYRTFRGEFSNPLEAVSLAKRAYIALKGRFSVTSTSSRRYHQLLRFEMDTLKAAPMDENRCVQTISDLIKEISKMKCWSIQYRYQQEDQTTIYLVRLSGSRLIDLSKELQALTNNRINPFCIERVLGELAVLGFILGNPIHQNLWTHIGKFEEVQTLIRTYVLKDITSKKGKDFYSQLSHLLYKLLVEVAEKAPYGMDLYQQRTLSTYSTRYPSHAYDCFEYLFTAKKPLEVMLAEVSLNIILMDRLIGNKDSLAVELPHMPLINDLKYSKDYVFEPVLEASANTYEASYPIPHIIEMQIDADRIQALRVKLLNEPSNVSIGESIVRAVLLKLCNEKRRKIQIKNISVVNCQNNPIIFHNGLKDSLIRWASSRGIELSESRDEFTLRGLKEYGKLELRPRGETGRVQLELRILIEENEPYPSLEFHPLIYKGELALEITNLQLMNGAARKEDSEEAKKKAKLERQAQLEYIDCFVGGPCVEILMNIVCEIARYNKIRYVALRPRDRFVWWAKEHEGELTREWPQARLWGMNYNPNDDIYELEVKEHSPFSAKRRRFLDRVVEAFDIESYDEAPSVDAITFL